MKTHSNVKRAAGAAACIVVVAALSLPFASCRKAEQEVTYFRAMDEYVYGFPLVITDLTRQVETAVPTAGQLAAPINQFSRVRGYIPWNFVNVVPVSFNSLWSWAFVDLKDEPMVVSFPDGKGVPTAFRVLNFWTDVISTGGSRQPERNAGNYLIAGPGWNGTPPKDKIGVEPGKEFDPSKLDAAVRKGINEAPAEVWYKFATGPFSMNSPNGWVNMLNIGRFGTDYQTRGYVGYMGLGAGVKDDIVYPTAFVDGDNNALDGA
ncbi:MAG: DUF1254 domain-containing protein [Acidobacteriaceae bacterium]|nr:DUF1254 domain-containing protein [Acidobacteriaceae bacterium]